MKPGIFRQLLKRVRGLFVLLVALPLGAAHAQQGSEELAKAAQNPLADMISLPFQNNTNLNVGPKNQTQNILNVQPVIPLGLNRDWNVITRTIVPVVSQPDFGVPGKDRENGLGDIQFSAFFSPRQSSSSGWVWGAGPVLQLKTATDDALGQGKWGLGPTAVALNIRKGSPWVYGVLINNIWSVAGDDDRRNVNQMLIQPFVNYNFPKSPGTYLSFSPIMTADWKADGEKWTVPLGMGVGQIFKIGSQPINVSAHGYYNVIKPDEAGNWTTRLQLQLLFPK